MEHQRTVGLSICYRVIGALLFSRLSSQLISGKQYVASECISAWIKGLHRSETVSQLLILASLAWLTSWYIQSVTTCCIHHRLLSFHPVLRFTPHSIYPANLIYYISGCKTYRSRCTYKVLYPNVYNIVMYNHLYDTSTFAEYFCKQHTIGKWHGVWSLCCG